MPGLEDLEKYRFDPIRQGLRQGTNLFVINMGMEVGIFRLTGTPRNAENVLSDDGPMNIDEIKLKQEQYKEEYAKNGTPFGVIIVILLVVVLVIAGIGGAIFFMLRKHKNE